MVVFLTMSEKNTHWYTKLTEEERKEASKKAASRQKQKRETDWRIRIKEIYDAAYHRSKRKGIECTIDIDFLMDRLIARNYCCAVTGVPLLLINPFPHCRRNPLAPSVDQIRPSEGYTRDNVRVVCSLYNTLKSEYSDEFIKEFVYFILHPLKHNEVPQWTTLV